MIRRATILLALGVCLFAGCGGDDEESADTATATAPVPTATTPTVTEAEPETDTEPSATDPDATVSRGDAEREAARQASVAAKDVPNSELFFGAPEDVECEAPDADQPDNANERAAEWTCTVDANRNGVKCSGSVVVFSSPGANPGKTFEDTDVRDADFSCSPA